MGKIYRTQQQIHLYECSPDLKIAPTAPLNYFMEAAQNQCESEGVGMDFLMEQKLAWFLVKYEIQFRTYPRYGQCVTIETEPIAFDKFAAQRRFEILDEAGQPMVHGDSQWMMLDRTKGRVTRLENIAELSALDAGGHSTFKMGRLADVEQWQEQKQFQVRYLDIDTNMHVNHVKYLSWAIETFPLDTIREQEIENVKIIYKRQAFYGSVVTVKLAGVGDNLWRVDIYDAQDALLCQIELTSRRRKDVLPSRQDF